MHSAGACTGAKANCAVIMRCAGRFAVSLHRCDNGRDLVSDCSGFLKNGNQSEATGLYAQWQALKYFKSFRVERC